MKYPIEKNTCSLEVKKSRFIGIGQYIDSISEVKEIVKELKSEHHGANHVVHAAIVGKKGF